MNSRSRERGFALLVTLWLIAVMSVVVATALTVIRTGGLATRTRMVMRRAAWAREACLAMLRADSAGLALRRGLDSVDLGNGAWCRLTAQPAGARLNVNVANANQLQTLLGSDSLSDAVLDWRDDDDFARPAGAEKDWYRSHGQGGPRNGLLASIEELALVRGFNDTLLNLARRDLTTRGDGRVSLAVAPIEVLATLPGLTPTVLAAIARARTTGNGPRTVEEVVALLAPSERLSVLAHYAELTSATAAPARYTVLVEGAIGSERPQAFALIDLVRLPTRVAIVGRETW